MARTQHVDRAVGDRIECRTPVAFGPKRRRQQSETAKVADRDLRQVQMRGRDAAGDGDAATLGRADEIETRRGRDLADMDPCTGVLREHQVARDRQRFGDRRRSGETEPSRRLTLGCNCCDGQPTVFGMRDDRHVEVARVRQHATHHAAVSDPVFSRPDRLRAGRKTDRHLCEVVSRETARGGGDRVDPEVGLADQGCPLHDAGVVQYWRLVGHQADPHDPAGTERSTVDLRHAEIDDARRDRLAAAIDDFRIGGNIDDTGRDDDAVADQHIALRHASGRAGERCVGKREDHAQPSTPRALRVSTSRQAMRTATPISTCSVIAERG